jgi:hypothetical protein
LAIRLPTKLKQAFPALQGNLKKNADSMTTHFDVYETLQQILKVPIFVLMKFDTIEIR